MMHGNGAAYPYQCSVHGGKAMAAVTGILWITAIKNPAPKYLPSSNASTTVSPFFPARTLCSNRSHLSYPSRTPMNDGFVQNIIIPHIGPALHIQQPATPECHRHKMCMQKQIMLP